MWQTKANSNDSIKQFQHDSYYMCELKWKKIKKKFQTATTTTKVYTVQRERNGKRNALQHLI